MPGVATEVMVRDVFPAEVYEVGRGVMTKVRVFLTTRRMIVWGVDAKGSLEKRLEVELAEPPGAFEATKMPLTSKDRIEVATLTRGFIVNKGRGCNCGPALKALATPVPWDKG